MPDILLAVNGIRKSYGSVKALNAVDLHLCSGEVLGLLGPNGAGKTSLMRILCGILKADAGEISYFGNTVTHISTAIRQRIGVIPQEIALIEDLNAIQNLEFFADIYRVEKSKKKAVISTRLEEVGLTQHAKRKVREYSGGMKRRLNIAAGLLHDPEIIFFDEPTVGVDPQSRTFILRRIAQLARAGKGILFSTHYMEEAEGLCDRICIMDEGKVLLCGTKNEIYSTVDGFDVLYLVLGGDWNAGTLQLGMLKFVSRFTNTETGLQLYLKDGENHISTVLEHVRSRGAEILAVSLVRRNLETIFMELTGRELRD